MECTRIFIKFSNAFFFIIVENFSTQKFNIIYPYWYYLYYHIKHLFKTFIYLHLKLLFTQMQEFLGKTFHFNPSMFHSNVVTEKKNSTSKSIFNYHKIYSWGLIYFLRLQKKLKIYIPCRQGREKMSSLLTS